MKKLLRSFLSAFLSIAIAMSVFAIVPITAVAVEDGTGPLGRAKYNNIATSTTITCNSSQDVTNTLTDKNQNTAVSSSSIVIELPDIPTVGGGIDQQQLPDYTLDSIRLLFKLDKSAEAAETANYFGKRVTVTVAGSTDGGTYTDIENLGDTVDYTSGYFKEGYSAFGSGNYRYIKYTFAYADGTSGTPELADVQVYANSVSKIYNTTYVHEFIISALYWSHEVFALCQAGGDVTIERIAIKDGVKETINYGGYKANVENDTKRTFMAYTDQHNALDKDYIYIMKDSGGQLVAVNYAMEDCSASALRKNAEISMDFGVRGKNFEGTSTDQVIAGEVDAFRLYWMRYSKGTNGYGAIIMTLDPGETAAGTKNIVSFSENGNAHITLNDGDNDSSGKLRIVPNGNSSSAFRISTDASVNLFFGDINTHVTHKNANAWCTWYNGTGKLLNKSSADKFFGSGANDTTNGVSALYVGGTKTGGNLYSGKIYSITAASEVYTDDELQKLSTTDIGV